MFSGQESTHFIDDEDGERVYLVARLNAPIQPINLGEQFEDPLEILMKADGLGEFIGGSSLLARDGSIAACDLELEVRQALELVRRTHVQRHLRPLRREALELG